MSAMNKLHNLHTTQTRRTEVGDSACPLVDIHTLRDHPFVKSMPSERRDAFLRERLAIWVELKLTGGRKDSS